MASKQPQAEKGAPAVVYEDEAEGPVTLESLDDRLKGMLEDTEADLNEMKGVVKASERNVQSSVAKASASLAESISDVAFKQHDMQVQIQGLQDGHRVTIKLIRQAIEKLEVMHKPSSAELEAARAEGIEKGRANGEKYQKSLQTQLINLKEKASAMEAHIAELERKAARAQRGYGIGGGGGGAGGGAEEAEDYSHEDLAADKAAKAENKHKRKVESIEEKDEEYKPGGGARPTISVKKPRNPANVTASSSSSSSSSGAKPMACDKCLASKTADCVCEEDDEEE
jgi:hypothetical protein